MWFFGSTSSPAPNPWLNVQPCIADAKAAVEALVMHAASLVARRNQLHEQATTKRDLIVRLESSEKQAYQLGDAESKQRFTAQRLTAEAELLELEKEIALYQEAAVAARQALGDFSELLAPYRKELPPLR